MTNRVTAFELHDGYAVETVWYESGTLCISTQAGCSMSCPFCASGRAGLKRNLTTDELRAQILMHKDVKRLTLSGIGEPLNNIENVCRFISESDLPVSVTTSVPDTANLKKILNISHNGLMLSLHAGTSHTHKKLIPKAADIDSVFDLLKEQWFNMSGNKRRKTGFNYLLFEGINDTDEEVTAFIRRVKYFKEATVHLLYCNPVENSRYTSPPAEISDSIFRIMKDAGLNVRRANRSRREAQGGCGTLFLKTVQK